eukprot:COSAG03_NODE_1067_length_4919_cov_1.767842_3_plen_61_part_00
MGGDTRRHCNEHERSQGRLSRSGMSSILCLVVKLMNGLWATKMLCAEARLVDDTWHKGLA